jgi:hypothetical protein
MTHRSIISDGQAQQIFRNDLRRLALEKHAADLNNATLERKAEIMAEIDRDIDKELRVRARKIDPGFLMH